MLFSYLQKQLVQLFTLYCINGLFIQLTLKLATLNNSKHTVAAGYLLTWSCNHRYVTFII